MASLTSFKIIIAQETSPRPRLAAIGEGGWPEQVLPAVGLSTYKTRVAAIGFLALENLEVKSLQLTRGVIG
ncbi:hypothetical protein BDN72DRAFT_844081, partial [Pluteus cervinus]